MYYDNQVISFHGKPMHWGITKNKFCVYETIDNLIECSCWDTTQFVYVKDGKIYTGHNIKATQRLLDGGIILPYSLYKFTPCIIWCYEPVWAKKLFRE
jgi:hypothetical protein